MSRSKRGEKQLSSVEGFSTRRKDRKEKFDERDLEPEQDSVEDGSSRELEGSVVGFLNSCSSQSVEHGSKVEIGVGGGGIGSGF